MRAVLNTMLFAAAAACAAAATAPELHAQAVQKEVLTLDAARRTMAGAEAEARRNGWNVVIAIVDDGGHLVLLQRMDGTQIGSVDVALQKARSAAAFRRPTRVFAEAIAGGNMALLTLPGAVAIEGGIPLLFGGDVVGAIGVSGVTAQQDGVIAQAGATALEASDTR